MFRYIMMRLLSSVFLILFITVVCFIFINLIPSDPAEVALRVRQTPIITEATIQQVRLEMGLDKPFVVRYIDWLKAALQFDFGVSYVNPKRTVLGEIQRALPETLYLAAIALVIVILVSIPLGVLSGLNYNQRLDRWTRYLIFMLTSMPVYWSGLLMIWVFSVKLHLLPTSGNSSWQAVIMPAIAVAISHLATYIRLIRTSVINTLKEDYILYAHVRGLNPKTILYRHILKNSLQSSIIAFGMGIPQIIAGTLVIENVFAWPGLGKLCVSAVLNRDYPIIQIYILFMGILFVLSNLVFDLIQNLLDPRTRKGGS